jgi:hypothetical protein
VGDGSKLQRGVEAARLVVECMHENCADADPLGDLHGPGDGVAEQVLSQSAALVFAVDGEAG